MQTSTIRLYNLLRYPGERLALRAALVFLLLILLFTTTVSLGAILVIAIGLMLFLPALARFLHNQQIGNALRVSKKQFPEIAIQAERVARTLDAPALHIFVRQDPDLNAYAFGWNEPQALVLTSELVEDLDEDELRFVIGHEMGHIALGHTRLSTLVGGLLGVPQIPFLSILIIPAFLWWSRLAEYSADRAGLLACGDLEKSLSALFKVMVGPGLASRVNISEVIAQSHELEGKGGSRISEIGNNHPYLVHRIKRMIQFWENPQRQQIVNEMEVNYVG